jgi:hypothetical protein
MNRGASASTSRKAWSSRSRSYTRGGGVCVGRSADLTAAVEVRNASRTVVAGRPVPLEALGRGALSERADDVADPQLALGAPEDRLAPFQIAILLTPGEMNYDDIEAAYGRRILGYREIIRARTPTPDESKAFSITDRLPLIEVRRTSRTTSSPISTFAFIGRSDRFEADYLIQS